LTEKAMAQVRHLTHAVAAAIPAAPKSTLRDEGGVSLSAYEFHATIAITVEIS
jgi:prephenate dehydrogenase